ncbi:MAG: helix-turn-helix domain-containing protein, partial [Armatimonadota bacterium]
SARKRAGLSLREVAARAGVSAQAISKYERGLDIPGSTVLIRLARELGVSLEWLLRPVQVSLSPARYRSHHSCLRRRAMTQIEEQVREWLERYLAIEDILGEGQAFHLPPIPRTIEHEEDVERVAEDLRRAWNLGDDAIPHLISTLEAQGIRVGVMPAPDHFDALTLFANEEVPVIVVKEGVPGDRQRMSLAHELGHLLLETPSSWGHKAVESAVFRFAGALLAPRSAVRRELGESRTHLDVYELHLLKHRYGISMQAWIHRACDLGILSPASTRQLYRQFRLRGWHIQEPGDPYPPESTIRLEQLVMRALTEGLITERRAEELLGRPLEIFWNEVRSQHDNLPLLLRA